MTERTTTRGFTMTTERAEEVRRAIWAAHGWAQAGWQYTKDEEMEIQAFWTTLPGGTSFYDVVARMAQSEHLNDGGRRHRPPRRPP
ncbi:hypothetical protein JKA73_22320 [Myxococcus xanthus]|uniref:hypothetical protein n=1 Tax=Myxococcus xanthus TaxID=34 RepID=UPI001916D1D6|nr:hypothetical protein [Myxococcus xanthus]QQR41878.1 hypothetical protein JKA73_22320 [Myxococcus xanthus]